MLISHHRVAAITGLLLGFHCLFLEAFFFQPFQRGSTLLSAQYGALKVCTTSSGLWAHDFATDPLGVATPGSPLAVQAPGMEVDPRLEEDGPPGFSEILAARSEAKSGLPPSRDCSGLPTGMTPIGPAPIVVRPAAVTSPWLLEGGAPFPKTARPRSPGPGRPRGGSAAGPMVLGTHPSWP